MATTYSRSDGSSYRIIKSVYGLDVIAESTETDQQALARYYAMLGYVPTAAMATAAGVIPNLAGVLAPVVSPASIPNIPGSPIPVQQSAAAPALPTVGSVPAVTLGLRWPPVAPVTAAAVDPVGPAGMILTAGAGSRKTVFILAACLVAWLVLGGRQ